MVDAQRHFIRGLGRERGSDQTAVAKGDPSNTEWTAKAEAATGAPHAAAIHVLRM